MNILYLIGGFILIILGANGLVDGSASIAKRLHVSSLIIGLTIIGFGTSTPELSVSLSSALKGSGDLAIGNIVGSNIFNTLFIVGCTALIAPIVITRNTLKHDIPFCILASLVLLICANDILLNHAKENMLSTTDGLIMLCFFAVFVSYFIAVAKNNEEEETADIKRLPWWKSVLFILIGLIALIYGGQLLVTGAIGIARGWNISESIIGITIVAVGTSLPELATSIVAAMKKNPEIAIGNVIGSNLFNIFFILGCSATITPLKMNGISNFDLLWLLGSSLLLWGFAMFFGKRIIMRFEGTIMLLAWLTYTVFLILRI